MTEPYEKRLQAKKVAPTFLHYLPAWQAARHWSTPEGKMEQLHMQLTRTNPQQAIAIFGSLLMPRRTG